MRRAATALLLSCAVASATGPEFYAGKDWPITGGPGGTHYSVLAQINRKNAEELEKAWQFDSGDEFEGSELECNPLVLDDVVYATTPRLRVVALDGATGKLLWDFDAHRGQPLRQKQRNRGLAWWGEGDERRIFVGIDSYLYALSTKTGQPVDSFGDHGRIDLHDGLGDFAKDLTVQATSPGVVYKDLLVQGSLVAEDLPAAPGYIRAFDVRTGKIRWVFHTIPQPGEPGYETWPKDAWQKIGGANSWAGLTLDGKRGLVFAPTGSASFDFYGPNRVGDDLYANCLLALNAETGKLVWHYQFVKHDVWDRDLPSAPTLVQLRRKGKTIDAVAQITKNGFIWMFERTTGKPLVPLETLEAPKTDVDGEVLSPTQVLAYIAEAVRKAAGHRRYSDESNAGGTRRGPGATQKPVIRSTVHAAKSQGHRILSGTRRRRRMGRPGIRRQDGGALRQCNRDGVDHSPGAARARIRSDNRLYTV